MQMHKLLTVVFLTLVTTWWGAWAQTTQGEIVGTPGDASGASRNPNCGLRASLLFAVVEIEGGRFGPAVNAS